MTPTLRALLGEWRYRLSRTRLLRAAVARGAGEPSRPVLLQLQTVAGCNGSCIMCPERNRGASEPGELMTDALYARILAEAALWRGGGVFVPTFRNEPLRDPRIGTRLARAREALGGDWEIELTTNGSLLEGDTARAVAEAAPDVVNVSVNASTAGTYAAVMPGLSWERLLANVEGFLAIAKPATRVILRFVRLRRNAAEARDFARSWRRRGVPVVVYDASDRLGSLESFDALRAPRGPSRRLSGRLARAALLRACPFPFAQASVLAGGDLLLCCHDYTGRTRMGNVRDAGVAAVFASPAYRLVRERSRRGGPGHEACAGCRFHAEAHWL